MQEGECEGIYFTMGSVCVTAFPLPVTACFLNQIKDLRGNMAPFPPVTETGNARGNAATVTCDRYRSSH